VRVCDDGTEGSNHRTWGTENTTKTDISSALVRSVAGTAEVTVCVRGKDGADENGCPSRVVINIIKELWKGEQGTSGFCFPSVTARRRGTVLHGD
jgi:hypothetical protein